jgi:hypothetical protein
MEPSYLIATCIGCLAPSPTPLSMPEVPNTPIVRTLKPSDYRTRCFEHLYALPAPTTSARASNAQSLATPDAQPLKLPR